MTTNTGKNMETLSFQSEVKEILNLMINSLYSNKDIFLRELISNASDASDKLRYLALKDSSLYENDGELKIKITADANKKTLIISDNGIGMDKDDVINNLGVIARSGTKEFIKKLGEDNKNSNLIGQFGVGFYSSFIVADEVVVETRKAGLNADQGVIWSSKGDGEFTIGDLTKESRGTTITLHLREDCSEFTSEYKLKSVIGTYSDHIDFPVLLEIEKTNKEEDGSETTTKEFEVINKSESMWTKSKTELSEQDYISFYEKNFNDYVKPLTWAHNKVEGNLEYTSLLYIPAKAPMNLFQPEKEDGIKLYVQKVFIMEQADVFLPPYLRFVRGLVDTNALSLNVSREILQDNKAVANLKTALTKRVLTTLSSLAENDKEKYQQFWDTFGMVLKQGVADFANKDKVLPLLRFANNISNSDVQNVSLKDYRKDSDDNVIYYLSMSNASYKSAIASPHLDWFNKNNVEVLVLTDPVDEWMINFLAIEGKTLQDITKADYELPKVQESKEDVVESVISDENITKFKDYFGDRVVDVKVTNRLVNHAAIVTTDNNQMTTQTAQLMAAMGQKVPEVKYILEINPEHKLIKRALNDDSEFNDIAELILLQAILSEKGTLEDMSSFIQLMNKLI